MTRADAPHTDPSGQVVPPASAVRVPPGTTRRPVLLPGMTQPVTVSTAPPSTPHPRPGHPVQVKHPPRPAPAPVIIRNVHVSVEQAPARPWSRPLDGDEELPNPARLILDDVTVAICPGQCTAITGPSGVGKSTLMRVITGEQEPSAGQVTVAGIDLNADNIERIRPLLGIVPQADVMHHDLTIDQTLTATADLRLPGLTRREREDRIDTIVVQLGLEMHRSKHVRDLSGGQRKRTSVAITLVSSPSVLILDEPTTGLDPDSEADVIVVLQHLADLGYTIIVVTHSPAVVARCDRVIAIGADPETKAGRVGFVGTPAERHDFFASHLDENDPDVEVCIYRQLRSLDPWLLNSSPAQSLRQTNVSVPMKRWLRHPAEPTRTAKWAHPVGQMRVQLNRTWTSARQAKDAWLQAGQAPVLVLLLWVLLGTGNLDSAAPGDTRLVIVFVTLAALILGFNNGSRELVSERPIYQRERLVGLSLPAYVASKLAWMAAMSSWQAACLTCFVMTQRRPATGTLFTSATLETVVLLFAITLTASVFGLAISAAASSERAAQLMVTVVVVLQLLLTGSFMSVEKPLLIGPAASTPAYWAFSSLAASNHLNSLEQRCDDAGEPLPIPLPSNASVRVPTATCSARWKPEQNSLTTALTALVLQIAAAAAATGFLLKRREQHRD